MAPIQGPKDSVATQEATSSKLTSMLPPPDPPIASAILEPEVVALSTCLKVIFAQEESLVLQVDARSRMPP